MPYTVVILTYNEQVALPACLASVEGVGAQVVVVDSGSTDQTVTIAQSAGAQVWQHPFESFGKQRQWAMMQEGVEHDWILFLDADERATPEFLAEVAQAVASDDGSTAGYDCAWRLRLYGTWLRRCDSYPRYQTRLVHRKRVSWGDWGHGQKVGSATGEIRKLREPYEHEAYIHGWESWWQKHRKYARKEALSLLGESSANDKTTGLKSWVRKMPLWPEALWVVRYILSGSFLCEGKAGWDYCKWRYRYERECARLVKLGLKNGIDTLRQ